jgi:hypothetical protein
MIFNWEQSMSGAKAIAMAPLMLVSFAKLMHVLMSKINEI